MKSNVSDHLEVMEAVYIDACIKCTADVSDLRDMKTIVSRVKDEGFSFLTITLPQFCVDFERSLADGVIGPTAFRSFRKDGLIPSFLKGIIGRIFDRETGRIYDEEEMDTPTLIESVRQICLTFKKVEIDCTPERTAAAIANFTAIEHAFGAFSPSRTDVIAFCNVSHVVWDNFVRTLRTDLFNPRHGPGATAERISGNQKYAWRTWHDRLEPYFPLVDSAYNIGCFGSKELESVTFLSEEQEPPVRVITVPKTLKSPRIIAIEPCCMQYTQHAIQEILYESIELSKVAGGHVNFSDQTINQELALVSSTTGQYATIDLSDASDRVPLSLAMEMFGANPDFRDAILACRSTRAELPNGEIISPLRKFASMGSALCFPVEAMYFYTICVMALLDAQCLPVSHANVFKVSRDIYVYGDDLIVPSTNAGTVLDYLQKYNCKINANKTFVSGNFRESCGQDAYRGYSVTPVYLRKQCPKNRHQGNELISWVATANLFYLKGYWRTATLMFEKCEKILGPLPYVSQDSSALGRVSFLGYRSSERWNADLHRYEIKAWVPSEVYRSDRIDGYSALEKSFHRLYGSDFSEPLSGDPLHLERSALYGAVALKRRWVPVT